MSNYWKKKLDELNQSNAAKTTGNYWQDKMAELEKKTEKNKDDDIAPVVSLTTEDGQKWYQNWLKGGAFSDGYQFGDIIKSLLATGNDISENVNAAVLDATENLIDTGAYGVGTVGGWFDKDFKEDVKDFISKEILHPQEWGESFTNFMNYVQPAGWLTKLAGINDADDTEANSFFDDKADSLTQSAAHLIGSAALQRIGVPSELTIGVNAFGSELENSFSKGATFDEAGLSAGINSGIEIITEKLFKGSGLGEKGLINTEALTSGIKNRIVKTLASYGVDMAAEGAEEIIAQVGNNLTELIYNDEKTLQEALASEEALNGYIDAAIGGAVMGGGANVSNVVTSFTTGKDYNTGLTQNEQSVFDKVYKDAVAEAEKNGKLTAKEKDKIYDSVLNDMEKGYISTDTIESVLGGETYKSYQDTIASEDALQKEFDTLNKMKQGEMTGEQIDRRAELKQQLEELKNNSQRDQLKQQLSDEVFGVVKDSRLANSYAERARRGQAFEADLTKYDAKQRAVVQKAVESGILNNTNRTHEFVDMVAKISADKGVLFDFTNNEKLKESGFAIDGKSVNGYVTKDGITVNMDSSKYVNSVVGHEITHILEGTELYTELQSVLFEYAKSKNDYQGRYDALMELYKDIADANIDAELTADLVGDYLFTDSDFINRLSTEHRNVFQKIYDEIKYLYKVATAGSKEARELEKVKRAFDKAYKAQKSTDTEGGAKYSLSRDANGDVFVDVTEDIFDANNGESVARTIQRVIAERFDNLIETNGQKFQINKTTNDEFRRSESATDLLESAPQAYNNKLKAIANADEILSSAKNWIGEKIKHDRKDDIVEFGRGNIKYRVGDNGYIADVLVGIRKNGAAVLYDLVNIYETKIAEDPVTVASNDYSQRRQDSSADGIIPQNSKKSSGDTKYSLSDNDYLDAVNRGDTETAQKMVDDAAKQDGYTVKAYHGTGADFNIFSEEKVGGRNVWGKGFYFGTSKGIADDYATMRENKGGKYRIVSANLKMENPFIPYKSDLGSAEQILDKWFPDMWTNSRELGIGYIEGKLENSPHDLVEFMADHNGMEIKDVLATYGFDSIKDGGELVVFSADQIKSADTVTYDDNGNAIPLSERFNSNNPDIRYSLSDSDGKQLSKEQQEYFKDSKMRDENGNLKVMYHGSQDAGFHTFDANMSDDDTSFFFVDRNDVAASYSGTTETYEAKTIRTAEDMNNFLAEIGYDNYKAVEQNGKYELLENNEHVAYSDTAQGIYDEFCWYEGVGEGDANYKVYLNLKNPLVVDAEGKNWNNISREFSQEIADRYRSLTADEKEALTDLAGWGEYSIFKDEMLEARANAEQGSGVFDEAYTKKLARAYEKLGGANANLYDAYSIATENFSDEAINQFAVKQMNTRDYAQKAKAEGYDGVIFNNIHDNGGYSNGSEGASTVAIAFESNQIKSVANEKPTADADIRYSLTEYTDAEKKAHNEAVKNHFGKTYSWNETGYLLLDGTKLDLSGKHEGASGGYRTVDHRDIVAALGDDYGNGDYSGALVQFMSEGNIRIIPEMGGINLSVKPTEAQEKALAEYVMKHRGEVVMDIDDANGYTVASVEYPIGTRASKVLSDIRGWFENGTKPEASVPYSLTKQGETQKPYGNYRVSGKDLLLEQEIAPVEETVAETVAENAVPDGFAPITEEEANALREDSFASLDDADVPPEVDMPQDSLADSITIDNKSIKQLSKNISDSLGLNRAGKQELERVLRDFSKDEYGTREKLYAEIERGFGTQYDEMRNDEVASAKEYIRNTKISVSPTVKSEFGETKDYVNFMRSNFGKIRFSKDGLGVDEVYAELTELYPALFGDDAINPADQLRRIAEVANTPVSELIPTRLPEDVLQDATDMIYDSISEYKETERMIATADMQNVANEHIEDFAPIGDAVESVSAAKDTEAPTAKEAVNQPAEEKKSRRQELHDSIVEDIKSRFEEKGFDFDKVLADAKDLSTLATVDNIPQRVMEKALGYKEGQVLSDITVNKVAQNETEGIKWLNSFTDRKNGFLARISKQYGIKAGSKESAAAQMYAEGFYVAENGDIVKYGDAELAADFPDANVRRNIKGLASDPRIRKIYDDTLAMINESRSRNAYPEIPRLDNYFLHFRAMEDTFSRLGLPFNPNDIRAKDLPTDLNGVTADLKPGQPYFASAMHRTGKRTSFDLLGGLERYLTSAKNQIYHIDDIQTLRALRNYIADTYGQAKGLEGLDTLSEEEVQERIEKVYGAHLSTFAKFLNEEANVLAGKTSLIDRGLEGIIGRRGITFIDTLNKQVGSNMVGFNVSSSLTNFLPVAQTFAKTNKFDFVKAFAQTVSNKIGSIVGKNDGFAENSPVMIRRKGADRFYRTPFQKAGDAGYVLMSAVDDISTELIARTKYNELTRKGMDSQQAHFETDKWVSRLMGDRSLGQQPQIYNSKMLGLFTKFQLEVRNQLDSQFYDTIQEAKVSNEDIQNGLARNAKTAAKVASTFVQLALVQHLFGKAFESVAGYNPAFDIISVLIKAFGFDDDEESEDTVLDNIEQGFLELLEDLPYTSTITGGGRIPISSALPIKELVTGVDQYGNEKSRWETLGEVAPYYVLPTGYGQIKKTKQGLGMFDDDLPIAGSYTDSGNLRFPVDDTLGNRIQAGVFGQWASQNARDYFDNEWAPLKEKQIQEFIDLDLPIKDYREIREDLSEFDKLEDKAEYIGGLDLTTEQKNILINNLTDRKEPINMEDYNEYGGWDEFDFAEKNPEKYQFFKDNGISYSDYASADEDGKRAYTWAFENPEKYTVSKAVCDDFLTFYRYKSDLGDIRADKDENGESISGSAKEKKIEYINNLDLDYGQKIILFRTMYDSKEDKANYNADIVDYLNNRGDISYEEMVTILEELDFTVSADGTVTW